ncbi:MAG: TatD family hydrolase, partial [Clostridia bacterium]|nr:TatD family hydrolase [Clostridia bacterium]
MILFDSHCHLNDEKFAGDLDEVIQRMQDAGVLLCTTVGSDVETSRQCIKLAEKYPFVFASAGVHPHDAKDVKDDYLSEIDQMLRHPKCVALGEIGLDYYYDYSPRDVQKRVLEEQIELAYIREMPVI